MAIPDTKVEMAWSEYKMLADNILKFDNLLFMIKSWSITTFGALLAIFFTKMGNEAILYLQIAMSFLFWVTDYIYKRFQSFQITRSRLLDIFLNNSDSYEEYRVPDVLFKNAYSSLEEQEILKGRGFRLGKQFVYSQRAIRAKLFFGPQTSLLYICQIFGAIIILVFY